MQDSFKKLRLIGFVANDRDTTISRSGLATPEGAITEVASATLSGRRVITATRDSGNGHLRLSTWEVTAP